jgi:hypothetical protein
MREDTARRNSNRGRRTEIRGLATIEAKPIRPTSTRGEVTGPADERSRARLRRGRRIVRHGRRCATRSHLTDRAKSVWGLMTLDYKTNLISRGREITLSKVSRCRDVAEV